MFEVRIGGLASVISWNQQCENCEDQNSSVKLPNYSLNLYPPWVKIEILSMKFLGQLMSVKEKKSVSGQCGH